MLEILVWNIRGRKDLTDQCFKTMRPTVDWSTIRVMILDASLPNEDPITTDDMLRWIPGGTPWHLFKHPGFGLSQGWNTLVGYARDTLKGLGIDPHTANFWLVNNDLIFLKPGWLELLSNRLGQGNTGEIATGKMTVFGHNFVSGAVIGFNLGKILDLMPSGEIMDLDLNYAYGDVLMSMMIEKAGYELQVVFGIEWGNDPYIIHLISQTVYGREGQDKVMEYRREEGKKFIDRYGRKDGLPGYEGLL